MSDVCWGFVCVMNFENDSSKYFWVSRNSNNRFRLLGIDLFILRIGFGLIVKR